MNLAQLRSLLIDYFSESELCNLCFDLGVDYDSLPGRGKQDIARELIVHLERRGRVSELVQACARLRPNLVWPGMQRDAQALPPSVAVPPAQPSNPFTYGNPITDPARFFGRQREVEQVFSRLRNPEAESSSLVGGRRVGKTSLLNYLAHPDVRRRYGLDPDKFVFVYVDLQIVDKHTTPARLWQRLLQQIDRHCQDVEVKYILKELRESGTIDNFALADLFDTVDQKDQHIVLLLDEFENVTENTNFETDFFYGLRSLAIQHNLSLVTSSHHELIELCHSEAIRSSPFFNIFANINVSLFSEAESRELITASLAGMEVCFTEAEIDTLFRIAGAYPFFLQAACHFMFQAHADGLGAQERAVYVAKEFGHEAAPHLAHYWRDSNDREKIVLAALALLAQQDKTGQRAFGLGRLKSLYARSEQILLRLEKRGLLLAQAGAYALFNTTFGAWIIGELTGAVAGQPAYAKWLESNRGALERLSTRARNEMDEILPRISASYRDLIVTWASYPDSVSAVAALFKSALE